MAQSDKQSEQPREHPKKVRIEVDNKQREIEPGMYVVSQFKEDVHVPTDKDLDQVIDGNLTTLADDASIEIHGGEVFFSHVRRGGSS